jgi:hypothetical protein
MSRLVIRNRTKYPDDEVAAVIRFACAELELTDRASIVIRVGHTRRSAVRGRAYPYAFLRKDRPRGALWEIHCAVSRTYPVEGWKEHGIDWGVFGDWREALVMVAAHEAKHIERFQAGRANGYAGEAACDAYAAGRLGAWKARNRQ